MKKVLLIDDDHEISEMICVVLGDQYEVHCQASHEGVSAKIESFAPDVVMLDNSVRQKNTDAMLHALKNQDEQNLVPVVLFSAHPDIAGIANTFGADAYLTKPFNLIELYACLDRLTA